MRHTLCYQPFWDICGHLRESLSKPQAADKDLMSWEQSMRLAKNWY